MAGKSSSRWLRFDVPIEINAPRTRGELPAARQGNQLKKISTNRWKGKIPISNIYYIYITYDNYIRMFKTKLIWAPQPMSLCGDMSHMKVKPIKMWKLSPVWSEGFLPRSFCKSGAMNNADWCPVAQDWPMIYLTWYWLSWLIHHRKLTGNKAGRWFPHFPDSNVKIHSQEIPGTGLITGNSILAR
jgi:hypothetical protein